MLLDVSKHRPMIGALYKHLPVHQTIQVPDMVRPLDCHHLSRSFGWRSVAPRTYIPQSGRQHNSGDRFLFPHKGTRLTLCRYSHHLLPDIPTYRDSDSIPTRICRDVPVVVETGDGLAG
jgi:hypothetical protein